MKNLVRQQGLVGKTIACVVLTAVLGPSAAPLRAGTKPDEAGPSGWEIAGEALNAASQAAQKWQQQNRPTSLEVAEPQQQNRPASSIYAPLPSRDCATFSPAGFSNTRLITNNCGIPIAVEWCWIPKGSSQCKPDSATL